MKNCPGMPGSSAPRSRRSSTYGPTASLARTLSASLLRTDLLLERDREVALSVGDRMDGCPRAGDRRDARDARGQRSFADEIAVRARARITERRVDHEVAMAPAHEVDDGRAAPAFCHLAHVLDGDSGGRERTGRPGGRDEAEPELRERACDLDR